MIQKSISGEVPLLQMPIDCLTAVTFCPDLDDPLFRGEYSFSDPDWVKEVEEDIEPILGPLTSQVVAALTELTQGELSSCLPQLAGLMIVHHSDMPLVCLVNTDRVKSRYCYSVTLKNEMVRRWNWMAIVSSLIGLGIGVILGRLY